METVADYKRYAEKCRALAARAPTDMERQRIQEIAAAWEALALERQSRIAKDSETSSG